MRDGWVHTRLDEVANVTMGQSPPGSTYNDQGNGLPFIQGNGEFGIDHPTPNKWCSEPRKVAQRGDVLLSVRAPVGATNIANRATAVGRGLAVLNGKPGLAETRFIRLLLQGSATALAVRSTGSTFDAITGKALKALPVSIPPIEEQRRIVDLMNHVDSHAGALRAELNAVSETHLAWLASLNARADAEKWLRQPLAQFTEGTGKIQTGPFGSQLHRSDYVADGEIPVVMPANMSDWAVNLEGIARITSSRAEPLSRHLLMEGDIAWARRGDVTRFAVIDNESAGALCGTGCFLIRPPDPGAASWLHTWLKTPSVARYLLVSAVGGTMDNLNAGILGAISVAIPPPGVIEDLSQLGRSMKSHQQALKKEIAFLKEVRSAVLSSLLAGKHQIPTSYDEFIRDEEVA